MFENKYREVIHTPELIVTITIRKATSTVSAQEIAALLTWVKTNVLDKLEANMTATDHMNITR